MIEDIKAFLIVDEELYHEKKDITDRDLWTCEYNSNFENFKKRVKQVEKENWVQTQLIGLLFEDDSFISEHLKEYAERMKQRDIMIDNKDFPKISSDIKPKYIVRIRRI